MANKGNFNLDKGGNGTTPDQDGNGKINLNKETPQQLENGIEVDAYGNPVHPVKTPQPEEPASVDMPDLSEEAIKAEIEAGPEEPRKKGYAWLWVLIGIAIVLAFLGMIFLNKGTKEEDAAAQETETVVAATDSVTSDSSADSIAAEAVETNDAQSGNVIDQTVNGVVNATSNSAEAVKEAASDVAETASKAAATASNAAAALSGSVETEALNAIRGDYGNGNVRKEKLGASYPEIQSRINQLKRAGKF